MSKRTRLSMFCLAIVGATTVVYAADTYSHQGGGSSGYDCGSINDYIMGSGGNYTYAHGHWELAGPEGASLYAELNGRSNSSDDGQIFNGLADSFGSIHGPCDL
jgi:hypothetical protein